MRLMPALLLALGALSWAARAGAVETVFVAGGDGKTLLATDLYLKDRTARPLVVMRGGNARSLTGPSLASLWPQSATYDLVVQDTRGTGSSQGSEVLFSEDGADGRALLAYLDQQPWSNKRVAMQGWSNAGIVDYLATLGAAPSLVGIQPNYATGDILHYGVFSGGVLHRETADLVGYSGAWQAYVGLSTWKGFLVDDAQAASTNAVGLHRGGWFDVFGQGTLDSFSRMQSAGGSQAKGRQKIVMGPWLHGGGASPTVGELTFPSSTIDASPLPTLDDAWRQGVLLDDWTAWNALDPVNVYVMGESPGGAWQTFAAWPPPAVEVPFYFTAARGFATAPGAASSLSFVSDPSQPCPTIGGTNNLCTPGGPYDQRPIEARSDVLVFESDVTKTAGTILGRIHADVWIATDLPDVDVFLRMTDVYPDGRSMLVAQGIKRARYRNGTCPEALSANVPAHIGVDLSSTAWTVAVGHALRVIVSASAGPGRATGSPCATYTNAPVYAVNPQNGDEAIGAQPSRLGSITVLTGGSTPSALVLPIGGGTQSPPDRRPVTTACAGTGADVDAGAGDASFADAELGAARPDPAPNVGAPEEEAGGCACSVGRSPTPASAFAAPFVVLLVLRRRRAGYRSALTLAYAPADEVSRHSARRDRPRAGAAHGARGRPRRVRARRRPRVVRPRAR